MKTEKIKNLYFFQHKNNFLNFLRENQYFFERFNCYKIINLFEISDFLILKKSD